MIFLLMPSMVQVVIIFSMLGLASMAGLPLRGIGAHSSQQNLITRSSDLQDS